MRAGVLQADAAQLLLDRRAIALVVIEDVLELPTDASRRIERRHRVLEHERQPIRAAARGGRRRRVRTPTPRRAARLRGTAAPTSGGAVRSSARACSCRNRSRRRSPPSRRPRRRGRAPSSARTGPGGGGELDDEIDDVEAGHVSRRTGRGSKWSRRPSPRRLTDRIARARTMPGNTISQGATVR